jgi:PPOX class probable F420-dependent enzyme
MTMTSENRKAILSDHRLCVVGYDRKGGPPALSPVYYVLDGDDLLISTTATRAKAKAIRRNPEVSLCVLGEEMPHPYLTVYGKGRIETEGAVDLMMRIGEKMLGRPIPETARPTLEDRAREEHRVVLRVTPVSTLP